MHINKIRVVNFRGMNVIIGDNGSGKSSFWIYDLKILPIPQNFSKNDFSLPIIVFFF